MTFPRTALRLTLLGTMLLLSCGRDPPTAPGRHSISGSVVLTGYVVDVFGTFVGTRVVGDADGVPVELSDGARVVARTTTVGGIYRFSGLDPGAYRAQTRVIGDIADHTEVLTIARADVVSGDTLRLASVGDLSPVPNPAFPWTLLYFELPDSQEIELSILDIEGRSVRRLVAGTLPPDLYRVFWDGRDDEGQDVNEVLYWATLESPGDVRAQLLFRYTRSQGAFMAFRPECCAREERVGLGSPRRSAALPDVSTGGSRRPPLALFR